MKLKIAYLKMIGVNIIKSPLYICADIKIDSSDFSLITIGDNTVISSEVRILTHDYSVTKAVKFLDRDNLKEIRKLASVTIQENCFIGMRVLILPGVTIGKNTIIGAGSVVTRSIGENMVASGNPAREICTIEEYAAQIKQDIIENNSSYVHN